MKISVIGSGRWGSFQAWYADKIGHRVSLCGPADSPQMIELQATRDNGMLTMPQSVELISDLDKALQNDVIIISVPSQVLRGLMREITAHGARDKLFILCMKGLEIGTGKRLTEIVEEEAPANRVAVWIGPGHVQEFVRGVPNCMVIDSRNEEDKRWLVDEFGSDLIRFYYGDDLIGNEIGAAAKNVVGIAAGMLDGYDLTSLKGALMSRGTREYARLIVAMGGKPLSAYGLCHLGDYEATVFSRHSHNRRFGEAFIKGEEFDKLAEGYYTVRALTAMAEKTGVELPISQAIYNILYENTPPKEALDALFSRSLKAEF